VNPAPEATIRVGWLVALAVAVNALVLFFTAISSDAVVYAMLSKQIAVSGDWVNLTYMGEEWLDKPHFPFWVTALSFHAFGVNEFAYVLPGLLFHFLGAWFTWRLARHFYGRETGLVAALFMLTTLRLLWGTADVRAEAFLVAEIVGATWFWVRYDEGSRLRDLLGGAVFTALALMTKGLFVLAPIGAGLIADWIRRGQIRNLVRPKWLLALALTFVFVLPELIALYLQFDAHPEKVVFGRTGVSGIRFFFWDSQFGRFFNVGPIQNTTGDPLYILHTVLWGLLPWTLLALVAGVHLVRRRKEMPETERRPQVLLAFSFLVPFVLFSLTKFQLDHYADILLPFAVILAARFVVRWLPESPHRRHLERAQVVLAVAVALAVVGLCLFAFRDTALAWTAAVPVAVLAYALLARRNPLATRAVVLPALATLAFFVFFVLANRTYFVREDAGHQLAEFLHDQPRLPLYDYRSRSKTLAFHASQPYANVETLEAIPEPGRDLFVVAEDEHVAEVLRAFPGASVVAQASGTRTNRLQPRLLIGTRWDRHPARIRLSLVRTGASTGR
jgi:4-amino-4-deoxy-L-arabinose transferase-like glycosyltransferase